MNIDKTLNEWVPIRTAADLPDMPGHYLFVERAGKNQCTNCGDLCFFEPTNLDDWVKQYSAWMPIPPYTPEGKEKKL